MPRTKGQTQYKKGAKNFDNDSLDFGKNRIDKPSSSVFIRQYDVNADDIASKAEEIALGKITQEMEDARAEVERREKISASNRQTRAAGRMFEEYIIRACEAYRDAGFAMISKVPEARRVVGRTGGRTSMMICVNAAKADPDFMGSLAPTGKCIVFDAKHTDKDRMLSTALTDHQKEIMERHEACGADCYVCVSFGFKQFFMIPYLNWRNMKTLFGRQYIMPDDEQLQDYSIPFDLDVDKKGNTIITVWFLGEKVELPATIPEEAEK